MKAAIYNAEGGIDIRDTDLPEPRPGWVRVAVDNVGICGTDLHLYSGALGPVTGVQPGHEIAGRIDACGDDVELESGACVVIEPIRGCGTCTHCGTGQYNRCASHRLFGVTARGGMAEFLTVPATSLYPIAARVPKAVRALAEPLAVSVRGIRLAAIAPGDCVAVIGAGSIGLLAIVAARAAGAGSVLATARHAHQAALARALGADATFADTTALLQAVDGETVDVVVESVGGHADTLTEAVNTVRRGGRIVMLGVFDYAPPLPGLAFASKELTLVGSYCYARGARRSDFDVAVDLLQARAADLEPLVTHQFSLDQVDQAFATAQDKSTASIKVQITP